MLPTAIDSVLPQLGEEDELLIIDNASTDETAEVLNRYTDAKVRVVRNPKAVNLYENHNCCIEHARGEWVIIVHSDEKCVPGAIAAFGEALKGATERTALLLPEFDRPCMQEMRGRPWYQQRLAFPYTFAMSLSGIGAPSVVGFRKQALEEIGGFGTERELSYFGDHHCYMRLSDLKWEMFLIGSPVEKRDCGEHQASWKMRRSGESDRSLTYAMERIAKLPSWSAVIDFLEKDIAAWPGARILVVMRLVALSGKRRDFKRLRRACKNVRGVFGFRNMLVPRLASRIGPRNFMRTIGWWRWMQQVMGR